MNLTIDSNVQNIIFNGNDVQKLVFNGVEVWSKVVEIYNNYGAKYLTFEFITSGTWIYNKTSGASSRSIYYRKNAGSWTIKSPSSTGISVNSGDIIEVYGSNSAYGNQQTGYHHSFEGTAQCIIYGNIRSLIDGVDFMNKAAGTLSEFGLCTLFNNIKATDISNLIYDFSSYGSNSLAYSFYGNTNITDGPIIIGTASGSGCMDSMFYGCTNLVNGPKLFSLTLGSNAYKNMFRSCSKLNYIEAYFTTTPSTSYTSNWMYGVQTTSGTFIKNSSATWNVTGVNGVPTNWTKTTKVYPTVFKITNCYNTYLSNIVASNNFTGTIFLSRDSYTWYGLKMSEMANQDAVAFWNGAVQTSWKNIFTDNGFTLGTGRSMNTDWTNKGLSSSGADLYIMIEPGNDDSFMIVFGAASGVNYTMSGSKYSLCTHCYQGATKFQPNSKVIFGDLMSSTPAYAVIVDKNY